MFFLLPADMEPFVMAFNDMSLLDHREAENKVIANASKLRFAAFRLLPYKPRNIKAVPVTKLSDHLEENMEEITHDSGNRLDVENEEEL
jgi:hypothetical protein